MQRILAAVDSSETSKLVVAGAIELARSAGAKLRLLRAVPIPPLPMAMGTFGEPLAIQPATLIAEGNAALAKMLEEVPEDLRDGVVVELGAPSGVICSVARAYDADVVVIGAHRYGVLERVLGTTAARIVNRIDRPVYVVRPPGSAASAGVDAAASAEETSVDAEIGVVQRELAVAQLPEASATLRREHASLERVCDALLSAYREGDWSDVREQWDAFEPVLRAHMELEEHHILPAFREVDAKEADALLVEHEELRDLLGTLGVGIDLHVVSHDSVAALVGRLRAHAAREELLLYPWIDWELDSDVAKRARRVVTAGAAAPAPRVAAG